MYLNRVTLVGFLGKDAEVRTTQNQKSFTVLSLATQRRWKDETGEYQKQVTWHRCVVWGPLSEFAATLLKGAHLQIEGEIRNREYTPSSSKKKTDATKTISEVRVSSISKLDRPVKAGTDSATSTEEAA